MARAGVPFYETWVSHNFSKCPQGTSCHSSKSRARSSLLDAYSRYVSSFNTCPLLQPIGKTRRLYRGVGGLDGRIELHRIATLLARPVTGTLATAERHMRIDAGGRQVDHHHARLRMPL